MLYADLTIFFVNVVQIVAHFHIKHREKVYTFGSYKYQKNRKHHSCHTVMFSAYIYLRGKRLVAGLALRDLAHNRLGVNALTLVIVRNGTLERLLCKNGAVYL